MCYFGGAGGVVTSSVMSFCGVKSVKSSWAPEDLKVKVEISM